MIFEGQHIVLSSGRRILIEDVFRMGPNGLPSQPYEPAALTQGERAEIGFFMICTWSTWVGMNVTWACTVPA